MSQIIPENHTMPDKKVARAGFGLKCFAASLAAGLTSVAMQAPVAAAEYFTGTTIRFIPVLSETFYISGVSIHISS